VATTPPVVALAAATTFAPEWQRAEQGEATTRAEVGLLYVRHAQAIHRFLCDLLGDRALAADATQEVFVRAFSRLRALDDRSRAGAWLFGIARNVSREFRKARRRTCTALASVPEPVPQAPHAASPEGALLDREAVSVVASALSLLSEDRREVLLLRLDHGLSYDQIVELTGWSLAKVKVEIFRAREQLREAMQRYEGGAP
jgi:RNA polymerase sigma-70 factor, ECF subfamily